MHEAAKNHYLHAAAASNLVAMETLRRQALASHRSLEELIGRDTLLFLMDGWNPFLVNPTRPVRPQQPGRQQPYHRAAAAQPARGLNEQGPAQRNQGNHPRRQGRMGGRPNHRREVYSEMIRMYRTLQGTYQHLDEASRINRGRN
ncbi:uncharacterized protein PGTG_07870 [Puccinia graminis f. sp. tritici CRL 75-36-700-3]|uniref:Uncharacterized protein n=1 Tax=Puccinia graminis f. sp. tritici (strain CRL 75-36-700-3 / race SCCL) TaxID=418459 RepID=E3KBA8_PUCGT|nr:uncharacterized protein PGTG_07870 [Puccinia graminis f. sp. tritici CRL 75-36-700-3]EFP81621.2 hypothetical protein PGTG_07870 [Puccinia graminis f. sp. tritici CRL 75-36-700-3]